MASYKDAIFWIAENDDTEWLDDDNGSPSVTACLVADLFEKSTEQVSKDLKKYFARQEQNSK